MASLRNATIEVVSQWRRSTKKKKLVVAVLKPLLDEFLESSYAARLVLWRGGGHNG